MAPRESDTLLDEKPSYGKQFSLEEASVPNTMTMDDDSEAERKSARACCVHWMAGLILVLVVGRLLLRSDTSVGQALRARVHDAAEKVAESTESPPELNGAGPYQLIEQHEGKSFFDFYEFRDGPDSIGSAGYQMYVGRDKAEALGLIGVDNDDDDEDSVVTLSSKAGQTYDFNGFRLRDSVRLEGNRRFDHGLILLDVNEMPTGCGVWPAFWTTDGDAHWPDNGEIDIVEPINTQTVVKTALHTSEHCDMYAHVPRWNWTGYWDSATGIPDTFTGELNFETTKQADNCWTQTPHQWANQGCVAISDTNGTIGKPINDGGGAVYALDWDPRAGHIASWVFPRSGGLPENLEEALAGSSAPDPSTWPVPYAFFAIGEGTGCSSDHFRNHRLILNLAFCGQVAGNRFAKDCPALYEKYNVRNDSVATCNAYLESEEARKMLDTEAVWKIRSVRLYQRRDD